MAVRADVVVFAVGAFLFAGGLYGIYALPESSGDELSGISSFTVTWTTQATSFDILATDLADGETYEETFELTAANNVDEASTLKFLVACSDNVPGGVAGATIEATLTGPNNLTGSASGACDGVLEATIKVQDEPTADRAGGRNAEAAEANVRAARATGEAVGNWTVEYTLTRTGGITDPLQTGGASVDLSAEVLYHTPELTAIPR